MKWAKLRSATERLMRSRLGPPIRVVHSVAMLPMWIARGRRPPLPPRRKSRLVATMVRECGLQTFIETGTYRGDTLARIAPIVETAISIELDDSLYEAARRRFGRNERVDVRHGDSAVVLPSVIASLESPAVFWLDGHYSGGVTALGNAVTPIEHELRSILKQPLPHLILIDDARLFGRDGYLPLSAIELLVQDIRPRASWHEADDIVRIQLD